MCDVGLQINSKSECLRFFFKRFPALLPAAGTSGGNLPATVKVKEPWERKKTTPKKVQPPKKVKTDILGTILSAQEKLLSEVKTDSKSEEDVPSVVEEIPVTEHNSNDNLLGELLNNNELEIQKNVRVDLDKDVHRIQRDKNKCWW